MTPFERFKKLNTEGNLWIYILFLARDKEIRLEDVGRLVFERFGFLPGGLITRSVLYRLRNQGYIKSERFQSKRAYKTTEKGIKELEKMNNFYQNLIEELEEKRT